VGSWRGPTNCTQLRKIVGRELHILSESLSPQLHAVGPGYPTTVSQDLRATKVLLGVPREMGVEDC
jgi:hypothetical protein